MRRFGYSTASKKFEIDPAFLEKGLAAAKGKYSAIRIRAQDSIASKAAPLDIGVLSKQSWIKGLVVDPEIRISKAEFPLLERLTQLEELNVQEHAPLDLASFPHLKELVLSEGTELRGLERVSSLKLLYLSRWKVGHLPPNAAAIRAPRVRISASRKLEDIDSLYANRRISNLMFQDLTALHVSKTMNRLALEQLHIEKVKSGDFGQFESGSLRKLFIWKLESLKFIQRLKVLEEIFFWELLDGDMRPVLLHPTLKEISFSREKHHYSHKLQFLRDQLHMKHAGGRTATTSVP
jgi:hypothetical protein